MKRFFRRLFLLESDGEYTITDARMSGCMLLMAAGIVMIMLAMMKIAKILYKGKYNGAEGLDVFDLDNPKWIAVGFFFGIATILLFIGDRALKKTYRRYDSLESQDEKKG